MEAASVRSAAKRTHRRRTESLAVVAYVAFLAFAYLLISGSLHGAPDTDRASPNATSGLSATGGLSAASEHLALATVGARAQRSTVGVDGTPGFVAWQQSGLTLMVTSRPRIGWHPGAARLVHVRWGAGWWQGTLARTDPATGLGLVRVQGVVATPLWQTRRPATVRAGESLVIVGRRSSQVVVVATVQGGSIKLVARAGTRYNGGPALNTRGRLIGIVTDRGTVVPIGRACGVIRRC